MKKKDLILKLYKILLLYEDACLPVAKIKEKDYVGYLERLYIFWMGIGDYEVINILKGLQTLGLSIPHYTVKSMVFHMINIIEKKEVNCDGISYVK